MNSILRESIDRNEFEKFLIGDAPYFYDAKTDNTEPQNISAAFEQLLIPEWVQHKNNALLNFNQSLCNLLKNECDKNKAIYVVMDWLWNFFYYANSQPQKDGFTTQDFSKLSQLLKNEIKINESKLKLDKRWAGAEWNSSNGLYEPIRDMAHDIENRLNGPKLID